MTDKAYERFKKEGIKFKDLIEREFPPLKWLTKNLIVEDTLNVIGGDKASCKTWLGLDLFISLSEGKLFLDRYETKQCNVIYFDSECGERLIQKRLKMVMKGKRIEKVTSNSEIRSYTTFKLDDLQHRKHLAHLCKEDSIKVLIFDPFSGYHLKRDRDADDMGRYLRNVLKPWAEENNITVIFIHHTRKKQLGDIRSKLDELRGSSEIRNVPDMIFYIEREGRTTIATFEHLASRYGLEIEPIKIHFNFGPNPQNAEWVKPTIIREQMFKIKKLEKFRRIIINKINEEDLKKFTTGDAKIWIIDAGMKKDDYTLNEAFKNLCEIGIIRNIQRGHWAIVNETLF